MKELTQEMSFLMNLWTTNTVTSKRIDAGLGSIHGIGFTEYMALYHLNCAHNKSMRRIDLAQKIGVTASGVTRLLSPMEKIGLVEKEVNERDARVSLVKLSSTGETILSDATTSFAASSKSMLQGVEQSSLACSLDVFQSMNNELFIKSDKQV